MSERTSRYDAIWEKLKKDGKAVVSAHPILHARISKAVKKRKNLDLAFKVANNLDSFRLVISTDEKNPNLLIFRLKAKIGIFDKVVT